MFIVTFWGETENSYPLAHQITTTLFLHEKHWMQLLSVLKYKNKRMSKNKDFLKEVIVILQFYRSLIK